MRKRATILISLVPEAETTDNKEIEKEILKELSGHPPMIPWLEKVEKVSIEETET